MTQHPDWLPCGFFYDRHLITQIRDEQGLYHMRDTDIKACLEASLEDAQRILQHYLQHRTGTEHYHPALLAGTAVKCLISVADVIDICHEQKEKDIGRFAAELCTISPKDFTDFLEKLADAPLKNTVRARRIVRRAIEILTFRKYNFDRLDSRSSLATFQLKMQVMVFADAQNYFSVEEKPGTIMHRRFIETVYSHALELGLNKAEALACVDEAIERRGINLMLHENAETPRRGRPPGSIGKKRLAEAHEPSSFRIKTRKVTGAVNGAKGSIGTASPSETIISEDESPSAKPAAKNAPRDKSQKPAQTQQIESRDEAASTDESTNAEADKRRKEEKLRRKEEKRFRKEARRLRREAKRKAKEEKALRDAEKLMLREAKKLRKAERKIREGREQNGAEAEKATQPSWVAINGRKAPETPRKDSHQEDTASDDNSSDDGLPKVPASQLGSPMPPPSKHLSAVSKAKKVKAGAIPISSASTDSVIVPTELDPKYVKSFIDPKKTPRRETGTTSEFFAQSGASEKKRTPAGTSVIPMPPLNAPKFGLVQEETFQDPLELLIVVKLLNKTRGHMTSRNDPHGALNTFSRIMDVFNGYEGLAKAKPEELTEVIKHLGLQNQRAKTIIDMTKAWLEQPPKRGHRYRTLGYPKHIENAGKDIPDDNTAIPDESKDSRTGAFEIGHIPGAGPYALDSWRIFCRDKLRGLAKGWNGEVYKGKGGIIDEDGVFEPEWKRVCPSDKELRAFLRWRWLKEGLVWDPETGKKERASKEVLEKAKKGGVV